MEIKDLSFKFHHSDSYFFKDIHVTFEPRKLHFLQGKNGSGKSTLFRLLQGKVSADEYVSGSITIDNVSYPLTHYHSLSLLKHHIHAVQQDIKKMIADLFTFEQNMQCAQLPTYPGLYRLPHLSIPIDIIKQFNIDIKKPVHLLSGGQQQILAILMVLQKPTTLLLLDEPTAALDEKNARMVLNFLQHLLNVIPITFIIISHDKELVRHYAQDYYFELKESLETKTRIIEKIIL